MKSPGPALLALLAAALLHLGLSGPAWEQASRAASEEAAVRSTLRGERRALADREARLRRATAARERLSAAPEWSPGQAPAALRSDLVRVLASTPVPLEDVKLDVRPAPAPALAEFRVSASLQDSRSALAFASQLSEPAEARAVSSFRIDSVPESSRVRLTVRGLRFSPSDRPASRRDARARP